MGQEYTVNMVGVSGLQQGIWLSLIISTLIKYDVANSLVKLMNGE